MTNDRGHAGSRFLVVLALIVLAGFGLRVVYVLTVTQHEPATHVYDATYYESQARAIADGHGYVDPFVLKDEGRKMPAADHTPLTVLAVLPAAFIDDADARSLAMRFTMVLVGTATIALIGLLTRRLAGDPAGIVAATIAALDPTLWMNDGLIMSETLSVFITVVLIAMAYRILRDGPSWPWVAAMAVVCGVGILARAEFAAYVPFLAFPAVWVGARGDRRRALMRCAAVAGVAFLVISPWLAFNLTRFEKPILLSTNEGLAVAAISCDHSYYGDRIGWPDVLPPCAAVREGKEQSVWNAENRSQGLRYLRDHLDRLPVQVLARLGRTWNVFRVGQSASFAVFEGRPEWATWLGAVSAWVLVPLAAVGAFVRRRAREPIWPLVVPIATACVTIAFLAGGLLRYRAPAEPSIVILAAIGVTALAARLRRRTSTASGSAEHRELDQRPTPW